MSDFKLFEPISVDGEETLNKATDIFKDKQIDNIIVTDSANPLACLTFRI